MADYCICYRNDDEKSSGAIMKLTATVKDVRALAKLLNNFKGLNPDKIILVAYLVDDKGVFKKVVHFLPAEYKAQRWLTGWKERLLAGAKEQGCDISWSHGLKPVQANTMTYEMVAMD